MKTKILYTVIVILIAIIITGFVIGNNFHSRFGMVTEIEDDFITVTCANGNTFCFHNTEEDWALGDLCSMIMYNKGTALVNDDVVVSARYDGFVELLEEIEKTIEE